MWVSLFHQLDIITVLSSVIMADSGSYLPYRAYFATVSITETLRSQLLCRTYIPLSLEYRRRYSKPAPPLCGYGLEAGMWGLGVDNILGAKLVTGVLVDTDGDADLLWAVRGAGLGNFGVICEQRLKAYPNPRYLAGFLAFPLVEGERLFGGFQRMNDEEGIPRSFSAELTVNTTQLGPSVNFLFARITEKDEDVAAGWAYLAKLKALGTVLLDTVAESKMGFPSMNSRGRTPNKNDTHSLDPETPRIHSHRTRFQRPRLHHYALARASSSISRPDPHGYGPTSACERHFGYLIPSRSRARPTD